MKPSCKRVLDELRLYAGGWVRGTELAAVGGFRFGARIHELRQMGYHIEARSDPTSAVDMYRLVPEGQMSFEDVA